MDSTDFFFSVIYCIINSLFVTLLIEKTILTKQKRSYFYGFM